MGVHSGEKKQLSARGILEKVRSEFAKIPEPTKDVRGLKSKIPLTDCLMSGLAMFSLKFPSLLQFSDSRDVEIVKHNLKTLYNVVTAPCDTYMRERLDEIDPKSMRKAFTTIFTIAQRHKILEKYNYLNGHYLLLNDGTGSF
jgi:hypothetical protein